MNLSFIFENIFKYQIKQNSKVLENLGFFYIHGKRGNLCGKEEEELYLSRVTFDECPSTRMRRNESTKLFKTWTKLFFFKFKNYQESDGLSSGDFFRFNSEAKKKAWIKTAISSQKLCPAIDIQQLDSGLAWIQTEMS